MKFFLPELKNFMVLFIELYFIESVVKFKEKVKGQLLMKKEKEREENK